MGFVGEQQGKGLRTRAWPESVDRGSVDAIAVILKPFNAVTRRTRGSVSQEPVADNPHPDGINPDPMLVASPSSGCTQAVLRESDDPPSTVHQKFIRRFRKRFADASPNLRICGNLPSSADNFPDGKIVFRESADQDQDQDQDPTVLRTFPCIGAHCRWPCRGARSRLRLPVEWQNLWSKTFPVYSTMIGYVPPGCHSRGSVSPWVTLVFSQPGSCWHRSHRPGRPRNPIGAGQAFYLSPC